MYQPLITIGLTTYNAADTVERALHSAFKQTWRPIEIIAVDDCSNDGTWESLERFAEKHSEMHIFANKMNGGVAVSRNRILKEAKGEFVIFFDDDDESLPERISEQYKRITEYECSFASGAPVICHTARKLIYPHGEIRVESTMGQTIGRKAPAGHAVAQRILLGYPLKDGYGSCPTCSQMARLSTYHSMCGFDPTLRRGEDTDFNIRLAKAGGHFIGIAVPLVIQAMTKTSEKSLAEEYRNMVLLMEKHRIIMEREGQYIFCRRWLDIKQAWLENRECDFVCMLIRLAVRHPMLTLKRLYLALHNVKLNLAFSRFHAQRKSTHGFAKPRFACKSNTE
jgi:glycosyltransferase involved in cell wall biosynthesis